MVPGETRTGAAVTESLHHRRISGHQNPLETIAWLHRHPTVRAMTKVHEIASRGLRGLYRIPTAQRDLVWDKPRKIRMYATLLKSYSPGLFWLWRPTMTEECEFIIDGMQRMAALFELFDICPPIHGAQPKGLPATKVQFNVDTREFRVVRRDEAAANATTPPAKPTPWVDVAPILRDTYHQNSDDVVAMAHTLPFPSAVDQAPTLERRKEALRRLRAIAEVEIQVTVVRGTQREVTELFTDINTGTTAMSPDDLVLTFASISTENWRNDEFVALLTQLKAAGLTVSKRTLLQTLSSVWKGVPELCPVTGDAEEWAELIQPGTVGYAAWQDTKRVWMEVVDYLRRYGVCRDDLLSNKSALVGLVALFAKFPDQTQSDRAFGWLLATGLTNRYKSASRAAQRQDANAIVSAANPREALDELIANTGWNQARHVTADDLCKPQSKMKWLIWPAVYARSAADWITGERLDYANRIDVHHVFPRRLRRQGQLETVDCAANLAWLSASTNQSLSDLAPESSLTRDDIRRETLKAQWIWTDVSLLKVETAQAAMRHRAEVMAVDVNGWVDSMIAAGTEPMPVVPDAEDVFHLEGSRTLSSAAEWQPGTVLRLRASGRVRVRFSAAGVPVLAAGSPVCNASRSGRNAVVTLGLARLAAEGGLGRDLGSGKVELLRPVSAPTLGPLGTMCLGYPVPTSAWEVVSGPGLAPRPEPQPTLPIGT